MKIIELKRLELRYGCYYNLFVNWDMRYGLGGSDLRDDG